MDAEDPEDDLRRADRVAAELLARLAGGLPPDTRPMEQRVSGFERVSTAEEAEVEALLASVRWSPPFDWFARAGELDAAVDDPGRLASLDARDTCHCLTILLRQERFSSGTIADAARSGLLRALLERFREHARGRSGTTADLVGPDPS
jgi:hypothetical protein